MENYLEEILNIFIINGRKINEEINVIVKLIKSKIPIDDVPWWPEIAKVLNEQIVVDALSNIAGGVLLLITLLRFPNSLYLLKKYTGYETPKLNNNGNEIIFAKLKFKLNKIIKKSVKITPNKRQEKVIKTNFKSLKIKNRKTKRNEIDTNIANIKESITTSPA